jgi:hypothetical protein
MLKITYGNLCIVSGSPGEPDYNPSGANRQKTQPASEKPQAKARPDKTTLTH